MLLIPDFETDYKVLSTNLNYTKTQDVNAESVQEIKFYLPQGRRIFECANGFIAFHAVWGGETSFLRAIKYDAGGNFVWMQNYTEIDALRYQVLCFTETADGGFAISTDGNVSWQYEQNTESLKGLTGEANPTTAIEYGYLMKCDKNGDKIWGRQLEFEGSGQVMSIVETPKGELLTIGCCQMNGEQYAKADPTYGITDLVLMKYNKKGDCITNKAFGGSDFDSFSSACYSAETGLVVYGTTQSCDYDITARKEKGTMLYPRDFITVFDDDLNVKWQYVFEGKEEIYSSFIGLSGGNIYLAGALSKESGKHNQTAVFRFNADGKMLHAKVLDVTSVSGMAMAQDGKLLIAVNPVKHGDKPSMMQICKLDENLNIVQTIDDLIGNGYDYNLVYTDDGGFFTTHMDGVKDLPQPIWMNRSITDRAVVLSRYDKNGKLLYRKTYDKNHEVEDLDIVMPLSNGKVVVDY